MFVNRCFTSDISNTNTENQTYRNQNLEYRLHRKERQQIIQETKTACHISNNFSISVLLGDRISLPLKRVGERR